MAFLVWNKRYFAHQYSNLDLEAAWETIIEDLPDLKKNITEILNKI